MEKDQIVILKDRGLISIEGINAADFLQNIISNDIKIVDSSNSIFSGIFTPQGKYLYEFFVIKNSTGYLIECENELVSEIGSYKQLLAERIRYLDNETYFSYLKLAKTN